MLFLLHISQFSRLLSYASGLPSARSKADEQADGVAHTVRATWENPTDTMTILLIIGGDTVLRSLAQLSGRHFTPVAFSFGWIAYSFDALMSVFGSGRLMPPPDYDAKVISAANGFARDNRSWVLGRLLRDFEHPLEDNIALCVTIFEAIPGAKVGVPDIDWCWIVGVVVILLQLVVAAIPCAVDDDWSILTITGGGTILALVTGALPQWRFEKWACRPNTAKALSLTGGNGSRSVMVIIGNGVGLDLEDLAVAESPRLLRRGSERGNPRRIFVNLPLALWMTQASCVVLSALWIVLLITVTSLKQNTWYLLLVGGLGMAQNIVAAGARRGLGASGIHLRKIEKFKGEKVMHALMDTECAYRKIGRSLLHEFFPEADGLRETEIKWWEGDRTAYEQERAKNFPQFVQEKAVSARKNSAARQKWEVAVSSKKYM
ncbi:hypothetical protein DENSPDRAFT_324893 [Dentipellis sp. KUC8613]|nr:hypothetical protein DENSPDRAFT_324893 [Dentipellis sp. KUC8613]